MSYLQVSDISKKGGKGFVVKEISFQQQELQRIAIVGETGSGKSTLLKMIAGLVQPDAGKVLFQQKRVKGPDEKLMPGHSGIAYLSQHFELRNNYRVEEELSYTNLLPEEEANAIYEVCRIKHLLQRWTNELSGGERQRIVMARLLVSAPKLFLLDEPFSNLDMIHKNIIKSVIHDISTKLEITCLLVSHDPMDILSWADEILIMKEGQILQQGTPEVIYRQPVNEYVAGLFGNYTLIRSSEAETLWRLNGVQHGANMLIRPEQFKLIQENGSALEGKVDKVHFFGSYYEIEVSVLGKRITVQSAHGNYATGETVYVSLSPDVVWYI